MNYLTTLISAYLLMASSRLQDVRHDEGKWLAFKTEHNKNYSTVQEETIRRSIFDLNKHQVDKFNAEQSEKAGFKLALNHLSDLSGLEMKLINGFRHSDSSKKLLNEQHSEENNKFLDDILNDNSTEVPDSHDWRQVEGRVSSVKNQGRCGSCWAFAATGALEGQEKVRVSKFEHLIDLSQQNLLDCVSVDYGCNGGTPSDAFEFVSSQGGIDSASSYPYEFEQRECRYKKDKAVMSDKGARYLPSGNEELLRRVVAKFGPVTVGIDASSLHFQQYQSGVFYLEECNNEPEKLDHAVLVVGYGTDAQQGDYWIVKNSWGKQYGEDGYVRMARNRGNNCGIATAAAIPTF